MFASAVNAVDTGCVGAVLTADCQAEIAAFSAVVSLGFKLLITLCNAESVDTSAKLVVCCAFK